MVNWNNPISKIPSRRALSAQSPHRHPVLKRGNSELSSSSSKYAFVNQNTYQKKHKKKRFEQPVMVIHKHRNNINKTKTKVYYGTEYGSNFYFGIRSPIQNSLSLPLDLGNLKFYRSLTYHSIYKTQLKIHVYHKN